MFYQIQKYISVLFLMFVLSGQALACSTGDTPTDDEISNEVVASNLIDDTKNYIKDAKETVKEAIDQQLDNGKSKLDKIIEDVTNALEIG